VNFRRNNVINPWQYISKPDINLSLRRIDANHYMNFFWGKNIYNNFLFVVQLSKNINIDRKKFHNLFGIELLISIDDESQFLILRLINNNDCEIFLSLCENIIYHTSFIDDEQDNFNIFLKRLNRWSELLKINKERVSEEFIKGLIGELFFLKKFLIKKYGIKSGIEFWTGPSKAPQDFCVKDIAFEVKSQIGTTKPHIQISSIEQLNTQLSKMYLYVITLGKSDKDESSISLPELISQIESEISENEISELTNFKSLLYDYGYLYKEEYNNYNYIVSNETFYEITDDFPKLHTDIIKEGINFIKYSIDLNFCEKFKIETENMERLI
jgi:hypothetical protein